MSLILSIGTPDLFAQQYEPVVSFSTFIGGTGADDCDGIAVDLHGNTYLGCHSDSQMLLKNQAHVYKLVGGMDAFVIKLGENGEEQIIHLGGDEWDAVQALVTDSAGYVYAVGSTYSANFPVTKNAFQGSFGGESDAFLTKLDPSGKIVWTTFLGGDKDEDGRDIALDSFGNIHIIGRTESTNFPTTSNAVQSRLAGSTDAFFATFDHQGQLIASTFLGGKGDDKASALAIDKSGRRYFVGSTTSTDFPVQGVVPSFLSGEEDMFVAVFDSTGSTLEYARYLGGSGDDKGVGIGLVSDRDIILTGITNSTDLLVTNGAFQETLGGKTDVFVARLQFEEPELIYLTYLGGAGADRVRRMVIDGRGSAFIVGQTGSSSFSSQGRAGIELLDKEDAFLTILDPTGSNALFAHQYGGQGTDAFEDIALAADASSVTIAGLSNSPDFPTVAPLQEKFKGGRFDIVVVRLDFSR